jgi:CHAT domain-containing protein
MKAFEDDTLLVQADAAWNRGAWAEAIALYTTWLAQQYTVRRAETPLMTSAEFRVAERVVHLAVLLERAEVADHLLRGLIADTRSRGCLLGADRFTLHRVHLALSRNDMPSAYELLDEMGPTLGNIFDAGTLENTPAGMTGWEASRHWPGRGDRGSVFSQFYLEMGRLAAWHGDFALSVATLRQGLGHTSGSASPDAVRFEVPLRLQLAATLLGAGDLSAAAGELTLLQTIDPHSSPAYLVRRQELWAECLMMSGEYGAGLKMLTQVVSFLTRSGLRRPALSARVNTARARIFLLQTVAAEAELAAVAKDAEELGDLAMARRARQLIDAARWRLARIARGSGPSVREMREPGARHPTSCLEVPDGSREAGAFVSRFDELARGVSWSLDAEDLEAAERQLREMEGMIEHTDSLLVRVRARVLDALLAGAQRRFKDAVETLQQCLPVLRALGLKPEVAQTLWLLTEFREGAGLPAVEDMVEESLRLEHQMARVLPISESLIYLLGKSEVEEKWMAARLEQLLDRAGTDVPRSHFWPEVEEILVQLYAQKDVLRRDMLGQSSRESSRGWRNQEPHRAMLLFAVSREHVLAVCVAGDWFDFAARRVGRCEVRQLVAEWHESVNREVSSKAFEDAAQHGQELAERLGLVDLLENLPERVRELVIVPDDSLHGFPFAALQVGKGYLAERCAVSFAYHPEPGSPQPAAPVKACLLAGVMYSVPGYKEPKPANRLKWMEAIFPGARQLAAQEVNRQNLLARLPEADLFHIVCHGDFHPGSPEFSGLMLVTKHGDTELLSLKDLAGLKLQRLQHATLASCWGADSFLLPGRWVLGIAETLWCAGAHSVLAPIWPVWTDETDDFLRGFYRRLARLPRSEALRETQCEHIRRGSGLIVWSGWQLYGETGRIRM